MAAGARITIEKQNRIGAIVLDRPEALNALDADMLAAMEAARRAWAEDLDVYAVVTRSSDHRNFCAGGDLKSIYAAVRRGAFEELRAFYATEYQYNWTLDRFVKPSVALIDGVWMGGGVGIALHGTHRVGGENLRFAMPECRIGFFPDVGATRFLSNMPGQTGLYLALTGRSIGQADAYHLDLITHCVLASRFDEIEAELSEAEPVDTLLKTMHTDPGPAPIAALEGVIAETFSAGSVEAILERLDTLTGQHGDWAHGVAQDIRANRPLSVKTAFRQLSHGQDIGLDDALRLEYRLACYFLEDPQFHDGIRATVIDKHRTPVWSPDRIDAIANEELDRLFAPHSDGEIALVYPFRAVAI